MKTMRAVAAVAALAVVLGGCSEDGSGRTSRPNHAETDRAPEGRPYELKDTQVWTVPDPLSGRRYQLFVSLPASYDQDVDRRYPVLYVTDADYAFPVIRSIARRVRDDGKVLEDFILVGLSYAEGDAPRFSRNRDYTPTPAGDPKDRGKSFVHGGAEAYRRYIQGQVLPFIERKFRADVSRRILMGHSYGGLLGAHILFTEPTMFSDYILGSPSLWYDKRHMFRVESRYAETHQDLPANVFMYIGAFEAARPGDPRYHQELDMVRDMQLFEQRLKARNYPRLTITSEIVDKENHLTVFPSGLTRGLVAVLPAQMQDRRNGTQSSLKSEVRSQGASR